MCHNTKICRVEDEMPGIGKEVYVFWEDNGCRKVMFGIPDYAGCHTESNDYHKEYNAVFWHLEIYGKQLEKKQMSILGGVTHWAYVEDFLEEADGQD